MKNNLLVILLALTVAACGGGSTNDAEPNANNQNGATTDSGNQSTSGTGTGIGEQSNMNIDNGSNAGPGVVSGNISFLGQVNLSQTGEFGSALFRTTDQNPMAAQIQSNFVTNSDTCIFSSKDIIDSLPDNLDAFSFSPVSAGDVLTLTSPAGTFAELVKTEQAGFITYGVAGTGNLPSAVPVGTTVDIPGDVFPAFSNIAVPTVAAVTNVSLSTGTTLTANSTVTWDASSVAGTNMMLTANYTVLPDFTDPNFDLNNFSLVSNTVNCTVADDGAFSFPADIVSQMGSDFKDENFNLSRNAYTFEQRGNALLYVSVSSSN